MPRRATRKHKKRMVGGANFKAFAYEFKVGVEFTVNHPEYNTNAFVQVDAREIESLADEIVDILNKLIRKGIELDYFKHIRNVRVEHVEGITFQLRCLLDVDEVVGAADRIGFIDNVLSSAWEFYTDVHDLPVLELPLGNGENDEEEGGGHEADRERYTREFIEGMEMRRIKEFIFEEELFGRNLAALKTGLTKGTKADPEAGRGLANMSPNILGRIGSFLSGREGNLNAQRRELKANAGFTNNNDRAAAAGAAAGAAGEGGAVGGAGAGSAAANKRHRTRRLRR